MKKITNENTKKALTQANIIGVNVLVTSISEVLAGVKDKVSHNVKFYIVTPNAELVLMAQDNIQLREALNSADFAVPDGIGLKLAIPDLNIIKGRQFFLDLIKLANENNWKVFFLGGMENEAELAGKKIKEKYKNIKILSAGGPEVTTELSKDIVDKINKFNPDLLFVAFGNPKQEVFIHDNLSKLNIKGAMAIGGTFRYIAGLSKLPPKWLASWGETPWRLLTEPYRYKRIWNAVVVFPLRVLWDKITRS